MQCRGGPFFLPLIPRDFAPRRDTHQDAGVPAKHKPL